MPRQPEPIPSAATAGLTLGWRPGRRLAGAALALAITLLIAALLVSLLIAGQTIPSRPGTTPDIAHLLRMSAIQAGTSTVLSVLVGLVLAWALDRLRFRGRTLVVGMVSAALVLPSLVVVSGLLAVLGRNGVVNAVLSPFGISTGSAVFGFWGIVIAHVLLNGAFAARLFLDRLEAVPVSALKLGRSLGLGPLTRLRVIDLPALLPSVPAIAATVFLVCFTSFAIVLVLGGGPSNQTFEVAIFEAVRLDFDLSGAVRLALIQLAACALVIVPATALAPAATPYGRTTAFHWPEPWPLRLGQIILLIALLAAYLGPLLAVLLRGTPAALVGLMGNPTFWRSLATSLYIGAASAVLSVAIAVGLGMARALWTGRPVIRLALALPVFAYMVVPAVVLGLGFFLLARQTGVAPSTAAPAVLVLANALLALPFAFAALGPGFTALLTSHGKLIRSLALGGFAQWRLIEWPLLAPALGYAAAVAFTFSLGDLGIIALFGTADFTTLPWMMYRAFGSYRTQDAEALAAVLLGLSILAFIAIPKLFGGLARARA